MAPMSPFEPTPNNAEMHTIFPQSPAVLFCHMRDQRPETWENWACIQSRTILASSPFSLGYQIVECEETRLAHIGHRAVLAQQLISTQVWCFEAWYVQ